MNNNNNTIKCPECGVEFELAASMAGPLLDQMKKQHEDAMRAEIKRSEGVIELNRLEIQRAEAKKAREMTQMAAEETEQRFKEKVAASESARKVAEEKQSELVALLSENEAKLAEAQTAQAIALKQSRELETARREMELTIERRVAADIDKARVEAKWAAENSMDLKVKEKEAQITAMQTVIADLKQKSEQGSTQTQGEVQEVELEKTLRAKFPYDVVSEVGKGVTGADCQQEVKDASGRLCGTIVWESKRTKSWSDGWLAKLRDDQRTAKADIAVLVSAVLPKDTQGFDLVDGVWVCELKLAVPLAIALRRVLLETSLARGAGEGQKSKMEILYTYLTGLQFRQRVQAIVEAFTTMQEDLLKEKKLITKSWAKRDEQLTNVMESTVGMYGDIQGIAGKAVQEIEGLEMRQIIAEEL